MGATPSVPEAQRRTVVCVGVTGAGKSTTCNLITSSRAFDEEEGFQSGTDQAVHCDVVRDGMPIRVIDTVGFFQTQATNSEVEAKFGQFSDMTSYGVDVFLLVEQFGRFTEANERHFAMFKEMAGPEALRHTLLVFTHITNRQLQQIIDAGQLPEGLQTIVGQVAGVVGVENKARPRQAVGDLHRAVADVVNANAGERYSNIALDAAAKRREVLQARIDGLQDTNRKAVLTLLRQKLSAGDVTYEEVIGAVDGAEATEKVEPQSSSQKEEPAPTTCLACVEALPKMVQQFTAS